MKDVRQLTLNTGAAMPLVGLGTWQSERDAVGRAVIHALTECDYRHIDCAWIYGNEKEIGKAFADVFSGDAVKREEVFVTSKLWNSFHKGEHVEQACKETLQNLKLDYLDLYLMHWGLPVPSGSGPDDIVDEDDALVTERVPIRETWEAMEELVKAGLVKAIGVSNFTTTMILDLLSYAHIPPAANQIELHPYLQQTPLVEFCQRKQIAVTAYSPLGRPGAEPPRAFLKGQESGKRLMDDPVIVDIARHHKKTPAQVLLRWGIERDTIVIPKSTTPERIRENIDVFDFGLSEKEMSAIADLDRKERFVNPVEFWKIPYFD